ncbi:hypothetical protein ON010_g1884 [Phytophthora cinnamomi]|nr:hypothetical protein ON010_g1884 [Phytophthora cinnamomi]
MMRAPTRNHNVALPLPPYATEAEQQLADDSTDDSGGGHPRFHVRRVHVLAILLGEHDVDDVHDEEVVGIVEEAEASDEILVHAHAPYLMLRAAEASPCSNLIMTETVGLGSQQYWYFQW